MKKKIWVKKSFGFILIGIVFVLTISAILFINNHPQLRSDTTRAILGKEPWSDFPPSIVCPNAQLTNSERTLHEAGDYSYRGTWETPDSVPTVISWYLEKLPFEGWFIDNYPAQDQADFIQYLDAHKVDDKEIILQLSVIRDPQTSKTNVILEYPAISAGIEDEEE